MLVTPIKTRIFLENENIFSFIDSYIPHFSDGDILVITSKIIALSEGRVRECQDKTTFEKYVQEESDVSIKTKWVYTTLKDGVIMANTGIDQSNVSEGKCVLLPKDSFQTAQEIATHYKEKFSLKNFGVLISDSHCTPLRQGITGLALGYAGFSGVKDYRNKQDLFGRAFHYSTVHIADCLASSAVLVMGEGDEACPLCTISDFPVHWTDFPINPKEGIIDPQDDMYQEVFNFSLFQKYNPTEPKK